MVALKLNAFGGMVPATDDRLLPENMAALAENVWLYEGTLQGLRDLKEVHTCTSSLTRKVFRVPKNYPDREHIEDSYWLEFPYEDVDVLKAPVADDAFQRYYWTNVGTGPRYNSYARIAAGSSALKLGVPYPLNFPGVNPNGGSSTVTVTRSYVYTWVTEYGEEGAPSAPSLNTGKQDDTWSITLVPPTSGEQADRLLSKVRIYRTITSASGIATYFLVDEVDKTTTLYSDTKTDAEISGNGELSSTNWTPPPSDLAGMTAMSNGMIVGFRYNEIWFCEPYRPHAWPAIYTLTVDATIVGIGVYGQTAIVLTQTGAYAVTGTHPSVMTQAKISSREPCQSRGSIVSTPAGVLYASPSGLALATYSGVANISEKLFTKQKWLDSFNVPQLRAAQLTTGAYYMFGGVASGCFEETAFDGGRFEFGNYTGTTVGGLIDAGDARTAYVRLTSEDQTINLFNDPWTGEVLIIRDGKVYLVDLTSAQPRGEYTWKSKRFQPANKKNLEAMKIYYDNPDNLVDVGTVKIYADDRLVSTRSIAKSGTMMRLPSGFKADFWQVEVTSRVIISSIQFATSARELGSV